MNKKYCVFLDLDGTLFYHHGSIASIKNNDAVLLDGTKEKLDEWHNLGYYIVLVTARPKDMLDMTVEDLENFELPYNRLIMGLPNYCRVLINDEKPYMMQDDINPDTARGIMVKRDKGIKDIVL